MKAASAQMTAQKAAVQGPEAAGAAGPAEAVNKAAEKVDLLLCSTFQVSVCFDVRVCVRNWPRLLKGRRRCLCVLTVVVHMHVNCRFHTRMSPKVGKSIRWLPCVTRTMSRSALVCVCECCDVPVACSQLTLVDARAFCPTVSISNWSCQTANLSNCAL
jgi:hypothetical protein